MEKTDMKKILLLAIVLLLTMTACDGKKETDSDGREGGASASNETVLNSSETAAEDTSSPEDAKDPSQEASRKSLLAPATNEELYDLFMLHWKNGDVTSMFSYASDTMKSVVSESDFQYIFCNVFSQVTGNFTEVKNENTVTSGDTEIHSGTLVFTDDQAEINFELSISNVQISGYFYNLRFKTPFYATGKDGVNTLYFLLENGDYLLNAAYVQAGEENAPVALLIPGSGPTDLNETIGILPTFQDLASALAKKGISSLRFEKRTSRYSSSIKNTDGLEEEYFQDLEAALAWLKKENASDNVWLLGHSLGANIAAELANRHSVNGLILWNGSARHLAEIAADQYALQAPNASELYHEMAKNAMAVTKDTADGTNYFTCSDYYWATYNELDTIASIRNSALPTLIINSNHDSQIFEEDIALWKEAFGKDEKVTLCVFDDLSHFGYKVNGSNVASYYHVVDFPAELVDVIASFIKE